ncbi:integrase/recombinase XerC/integrase/recombinase XerD [Sediminihabitans luteus]|uniref:Integrase/recombinase XerC/integrase/recombinase XerD n=1 Tax=Sediminihabitans luteus TaxID=1138585 RepID=A0A2M9CQN8_9CELL|nr:tyrosine-type recombinase/integrase [Sediminihabitans luteus]PJJ74243.1 integrase/recombinase XerC/integrase/recombinase XerD [Sediminihabitans luteus]GII99096.1 tyrosine recombinase XerD [Sediminihabitans luteus]
MVFDVVPSGRTAAADVRLDRAHRRWLAGLAPSTRRGYSADVAAWLAWCAAHGVDAGHPSGRDLGEYLDTLADTVSIATRARRLAAVRSFYAWARDEGASDADPNPPRRSTPRVRGLDAARLGGLSATEARTLMSAADAHHPRSAALVALLLTTGLRISEALSVSVGDLRPDTHGRVLLTVTGKGSKVRTVVVPELAAHRCTVIAGQRGRTAALFVTRTGKRWSADEARDHLARLGRRCGLMGLHPHALRHTAATLALAGGTNIEAVRAMLGHASLATTQRYVTAAGALDASPAEALAAQFVAPTASEPTASGEQAPAAGGTSTT